MWTCGIDIAMQHVRPATIRSPWSAPGEKPSGRGEPVAARAPAGESSNAGGRRRSTSASGRMTATQKRPMPTCVWRQPAVSTKCCTIGGHTAPAR